MPSENKNDILSRLEHLMYVYNYQVKYGIDIFDNCTTLDSFNKKLKQAYNKSRPEEVKSIVVSNMDFWEEIDFGLSYRGDSAAGLKLN